MTIIGLVGPFGSGCTYVAKEILEKELGYRYISLSDILREEYRMTEGGNSEKPDRRVLQDFGDAVREEKGTDYLAQKAARKIKEALAEGDANFVIDSIRNPEEVYFLKSQYVDFFVIGIFAGSDLRWKRVQDSYDRNQGLFLEDEKRDKGEKIAYGQRVTDAFLTSDAIILNETEIVNQNEAYKTIRAKIEKYINLFIGKATDKTPSEKEAIMAMAYSNSLRSSCLKRKVGAVIADSKGNIFSSGYNEVPFLERPCLSMYGDCYRSVSKKGIEELFDTEQETLSKKVMEKVKLLEKCRALHAEENAIVNVARFGSTAALENATLYTTTYPCNLCANKIAQVGGIQKVVYYEPYPVEEAKRILEKAGIQQEMFEGITFNAYFRVFNEIIM
ncbi:MAG: deaminase [Candidatus Gastranaerophilales bacterium]|nr:deaminase [Candidatus Gastranaerophilales bacterium]